MQATHRGHVGMVLETAFPPDARVEREAKALIEAGYRVTLLCFARPTDPLGIDHYEGMEIYRVRPSHEHLPLKFPGFKPSFGFSGFHRGCVKSLINWIWGIDSSWFLSVLVFLRHYQPDIVHIHDLKLLKPTLMALRWVGKKPVISDLHENYPVLAQQLVARRKGKAKGLAKKLHWEAIERKFLKYTDAVIVVEEEAKNRLTKAYGLKETPIHIIRNVVDLDKFLSPAVQALTVDNPEQYLGRFILTYVGFVNSNHRGIHTVLKALPLLIPHIPNIMLVCAGQVSQAYDEQYLQPLIKEHQLDSYAHFTGFCDETQFAPYIKLSNIGLCPHEKTALTDSTFPNKVFLYSLFQKPIISSDCIPLKRYIDETESGLCFDSHSHKQFADCVLQLYRDQGLSARLAQSGYEAVTKRYNWQYEKNALISLYDSLLSKLRVN